MNRGGRGMRAGELTAGGLRQQRIGELPFGAIAVRDWLRLVSPDADRAHGLGPRRAEVAR